MPRVHIHVSRLVLAPVIICAWLASPATPSLATTAYDWPQFDGNAQHSGNNTRETTLGPSNVAQLHRLWVRTLHSTADGAPVELAGVTISGATHNVLFITSVDGTIAARDATTGAPLWSRLHGGVNYTTSSPAVAFTRRYVFTYGLDGYIHKHAVATGAEAIGNGWPELVTRKPQVEKGSSALSIAAVPHVAPFLYMASGGYPGDAGDYQGHITAINLNTTAQKVFNTNCSNAGNVHFEVKPTTPYCNSVQSAVWARPGVVYDPGTGRIFLATGNGPYDPTSFDWADSVLALHPDGTGSGSNPLDSYTPANFQDLQNTDADLGSTAPAILPMPADSAYAHVAVQGGKDQLLRLINLANLSNVNGPPAPGNTGGEIGTPIAVPQGGEVLTQPAVWRNPVDGAIWVFVGNYSGISGLRVQFDTNHVPYLNPMWKKSSYSTSPLVANNVLYVAGSDDATHGHIQARDPETGALLWQNSSLDHIHWASPMVANGILYITANGKTLTAFGLP